MDPASVGLLALAFIVATIAVGAFVKGITGLGLPIFAIPALAMFMPVESAVVIMTIPSLLANGWLITAHRQHVKILAEHRAFLVLGVIGTFAGTWVLASFNDDILKTLLAIWLGVYLLQKFLGKDTSRIFSGRGGVSGPLGFSAGALQGATGISAPVVAPYFHARDLTLSAYAFAVAFAFALFTIAQLAAMTTVNLLTPALLGFSVLASVTTLVFTPLGVRYSSRLSQKVFDRFLLGTFVLIELKLAYDIVT